MSPAITWSGTTKGWGTGTNRSAYAFKSGLRAGGRNGFTPAPRSRFPGSLARGDGGGVPDGAAASPSLQAQGEHDEEDVPISADILIGTPGREGHGAGFPGGKES